MNSQLSVLVTGVSTGIGLGITEVLVAKGIRVFGSVRRLEDAAHLKQVFQGQVVPLVFDVTDVSAVMAASEQVRQMLDGGSLLGLVNNAGAGTAGPLLHLRLDEFRQQLEVNLVAPLSVTQHFSPLLRSTAKTGRIINIGSTASRIGIPFMGAYSASKHGLEGLSESLRRELLIYGIDVITVIPGPVKTAIWDKAEALDFSAYKTTPYGSLVEAFRSFMVREGRSGLDPKQIGSIVFAALTQKHPRAVYVLVPKKFMNWTLPTVLPTRLVDKLMGRQFGLVASSGKSAIK